VRNVLDRIGTPEEVVAAAAEGQPAVGDSQTGRFGTLEVAAVLMLGLGGFFFPVVGWLVGFVLVWMSGAWSFRDKLIATAGPVAVVFVVPLLFLFVGVVSGVGGPNVGPIEWMFIAGAGTGWLGGVLGALYLAVRLSVTTRADHKRDTC